VTTAPPLLQVEALCSGYGPLRVLFGVDLDVRAGEIVALMGSNGAGKTTTLRTITGQLRPTAGRVLLDGEDIRAVPAEILARRGVALVPEGRGMLRDLTVEQNLELGAYVVRDKRAVRDAFTRAYSLFPILEERRTQLAGRLSGGQQQLLALARALMSSPRLLLVDEASLGLSPIMTETAFDILREINHDAGVTILLIEQNVWALDLAHRAFVLERGRVVDAAEGDAVRSMQERLRRAYLGAVAGGDTL
jgi:branched-chain amino acid transport system ATP-binding protein